MRITIYYQSGRVHEFNLETFCAKEPFPAICNMNEGVNLATELNLRLDRLEEEEGLILEVHWHNTIIDENTAKTVEPVSGREIYHVGREPGRIIRLISKKELKDVLRIQVDGEVVVFRQGDHLVNAIKFSHQATLCSSKNSFNFNQRALEIYTFLKNAHPLATDEEICQMFGYSYEAFKEIMDEMLAQEGSEDDEDPVFDSKDADEDSNNSDINLNLPAAELSRGLRALATRETDTPF